MVVLTVAWWYVESNVATGFATLTLEWQLPPILALFSAGRNEHVSSAPRSRRTPSRSIRYNRDG
jgi:hypothetical protein